MAKQVTDRALRYRANATPPPKPKLCGFCGSNQQIQVGHVNGHEEDGEPENLIWTCRSCNQIHANTLRAVGLGRLTKQYNPKAAGAANILQYSMAVDSIQRRHPKTGALMGWGGKSRPIDVDKAVAMIRATPPSDRSRFAREIWRHRKARSNPAGLTYTQAMLAARKAGARIGDTSGFEPWLLKTKLDKRSPQIKSKLEREFWRGVEEGEGKTESASFSYKGASIHKIGDGYQVSTDPDSRFDSLKDAKRFIDADLKRNPRSAFHEAYRKLRTSPELRRELQKTLGPTAMQGLREIYQKHLKTVKQLRRVRSEIRRLGVSA